MIKRLQNALTKANVPLTDDQSAKIQTLLQNQREQMQGIRNDDSLSDDDQKAKIHELMTTTHDQIRAVLTQPQQAVFDKMPMNGAHRHRPADEPPSSSNSNESPSGNTGSGGNSSSGTDQAPPSN
jgi:hypothetical protein